MSESRLFISYATDDRERVQDYVAELAKRGIDVWIDHLRIKPGDDLVRAINDGLSAARYAVIFHSARYAAKNWTNAEMNALIYAAVVANERRVFVVQLDAAP